MAKKKNYNQTTRDTLIEELATLRASLQGLAVEKRKTGNPKNYRSAKKDIARILTALARVSPSGQSEKNK